MTESTGKLLEKHLDPALEAPDGIAKLRELILTLVMQGKLVPQDPNDPPANEVSKEIRWEKALLVKLGFAKAALARADAPDSGTPWRVPEA